MRVANELVGSVFLRDVSPVPQVTARMLARARRNKHPIYAKVAELWAEFEASVVRQDLDAIKEILARGWLGPRMTEDTDSLFQLYVLVCVLEALEDVILQGQGSAKFGLIRSEGAAAVAVYEGPAWKAEVFYDKAPSTALGFHGGGSFYIRMMELFRGLSGAPRRPDVSVRLTGGRGGEVRLIVEAKNTDPASRYGGDSVYKAFGYLRDYEGLWRQDQHPKIVLAYPRGTAPTSQSSFTAEDLAIISGDLRAQFKTILTHLIGASD
ncbi:MAG: hypothetical protein H5U03_06175 [Clostridia bacterium]|nr:hypothetical protein [Clostridia bacterium]